MSGPAHTVTPGLCRLWMYRAGSRYSCASLPGARPARSTSQSPCRLPECRRATQHRPRGTILAHRQEQGGAFGGARSMGPERVRTAPHPQPGARHAHLGNPPPRLHQTVVPVPHPGQPAPFRLDAAGMPPALGGHPNCHCVGKPDIRRRDPRVWSIAGHRRRRPSRPLTRVPPRHDNVPVGYAA